MGNHDASFLAQILRANSDIEKYGINVLDGIWRNRERKRGPIPGSRGKHVGPTFPKGSKQQWLREVMSAHHKKGNLTMTSEDIRKAAEDMGISQDYARAVIKHMLYLSRSDNCVTIHSKGIYSLSEKYRI